MNPVPPSMEGSSLLAFSSLPIVCYTVEARNIEDFNGFEVIVAKVDYPFQSAVNFSFFSCLPCTGWRV